MLLDIIIFVAISAFVIIKLRSILGNEYSDEVPQSDRRIRQVEGVSSDLSDQDVKLSHAPDNSPAFIMPNAVERMEELSTTIGGIDAKNFVEAAKKVFEIMLNGYTTGDLSLVKELVSEEMFARIDVAVKKSKESGLKSVNLLVKIDNAIVTNVDIADDFAVIYVKFVSQQINYSEKIDNGEIVDGNKGSINNIHEIWKFKKDISSSNRNWLLVGIEDC